MFVNMLAGYFASIVGFFMANVLLAFLFIEVVVRKRHDYFYLPLSLFFLGGGISCLGQSLVYQFTMLGNMPLTLLGEKMETIRSDKDKGIDISIKRYAHMFISVVAYHIMHAIEHRLHQKKDSRTWETIKSLLKTHNRITISFNKKMPDGKERKQMIRLSTRLEESHAEIYLKLGLDGVPLPRKLLLNSG